MPTPHAQAVPLLIGVTGHREIEPEQKQPLQAAVVRVLSELRQEYPSTPLAVLSPLAGDADRWVAEAATRVRGVDLVAVLPWPQPMDATIGTPDEARGRCRLVDVARQVVMMPLPDGIAAETLRDDEEAREAQLDEVGRYIARHCQSLFAVWEGQSDAASNTAKVIRYHADGTPAPFSHHRGRLDTVDKAVVVELLVRRRSASPARDDDASPAVVVPRWTWPVRDQEHVERVPPQRLSDRVGRLPNGTVTRKLAVWRQWLADWFWWWTRTALLLYHHSLETTVHRLGRLARGGANVRTPDELLLRNRWQAIDRYNHDIRGLSSNRPDEVARSRGHLISDEQAERLSPCVRNLREAYGLADAAAQGFQRWHWWIVLVLFAVALAAVACLEVHAHKWFDPIMLMGYLGLLVVGYVMFRVTRWKEHQGRWLDYRAFAEALRVQVYWRWADLENCAADHYLRHFRGELEWIRHALRATYLMAGGHEPVEDSSLAESRQALRLIAEVWVADQQSFFTKKAPVNDELAVSFHAATQLMLATAVVLAILQMFLQHDASHPIHTLVLATFFCLLIAAMLEKFSDIHAYGLLARRYRWMAALYQIAGARLTRQLDASSFTDETVDRSQQLLFELGCEALSENADWVIQYRQRPPILPSG